MLIVLNFKTKRMFEHVLKVYFRSVVMPVANDRKFHIKFLMNVPQ